MPYRIEFTHRAQRDFRKLPKQAQTQVAAAIDDLEEDPRGRGVKRLAAKDAIYRLRSGDFRILFRIEDEALIVLVVGIGNRRDVYRRLQDL